jgi:hypothetical protein
LDLLNLCDLSRDCSETAAHVALCISQGMSKRSSTGKTYGEDLEDQIVHLMTSVSQLSEHFALDEALRSKLPDVRREWLARMGKKI